MIADPCETETAPAAALVLANGEPTGVEHQPWLVLRRVEEGSIYIPEDAPFLCEIFDRERALAFRRDGKCNAPLLLNVPDGRTSSFPCSVARLRNAVPAAEQRQNSIIVHYAGLGEDTRG